MLLISVRKKQLFFWLVLVLAVAAGRLSYQTILADRLLTQPAESQIQPETQIDYFLISRQGEVRLNQTSDVSRFLYPDFQTGQARFEQKLVDHPGNWMKRFRVVIDLPANLPARVVKVEPILSYTPITQAKIKRSGHQIEITAFDLGPQALFTLHLSFPLHYLKFPFFKIIWYWLKSQNLIVWLLMSILFPLGAWLFFLFLLFNQFRLRRQLQTDDLISHPPSRLNPALVSLLYQHRLGARAINAFLLNLANKGFLEIVFKDNGFSFGRLRSRGKTRNLSSAERVLLSKLFQKFHYQTSEDEIRWRLAHRLFSNKIALLYYLIYHQAFEEGFFTAEPNRLHRRYRKIGLLFFFSGFIGIIGGLLFQTPSLIISWFGLLIAGSLFVRLSTRINFLSQRGFNELAAWLKFRNFLISSQPLSAKDKELFFSYLPYAVALNCEEKWLARFSSVPLTAPDWYFDLTENAPELNSSQKLLNLLNWLARSLAYIKAPAD